MIDDVSNGHQDAHAIALTLPHPQHVMQGSLSQGGEREKNPLLIHREPPENGTSC